MNSPRRTSKRRVFFTTDRIKRRHSPRSKIIKKITSRFTKLSFEEFKNKYARDIGELTQALSPYIVGLLLVYLQKDKIFNSQ